MGRNCQTQYSIVGDLLWYAGMYVVVIVVVEGIYCLFLVNNEKGNEYRERERKRKRRLCSFNMCLCVEWRGLGGGGYPIIFCQQRCDSTLSLSPLPSLVSLFDVCVVYALLVLILHIISSFLIYISHSDDMALLYITSFPAPLKSYITHTHTHTLFFTSYRNWHMSLVARWHRARSVNMARRW